MSATPLIRLAVAEDAPALHAAVHALSRHLGNEAAFTAAPDDYLAHGFGERALFTGIVAEAGGGICAAAIFFPEFSTHRGRAGVYLQDLWVSEARRRGGLGRRMLAAAFAEAQAWGAAYMKLSAHLTNPLAIGFYESLGFASDPEERVFVLDGARLASLAGPSPAEGKP